MGRKTRDREDHYQKSMATVVEALNRPIAKVAVDAWGIARGVAGFDPERNVRPLNSWRQPKTKDNGKLALSVAKHVYGKFPVPHHLETVWSNPSKSSAKNDRIKTWFVSAATGQSVHKLLVQDLVVDQIVCKNNDGFANDCAF